MPAFALAALHGVRPATFLLADGLSALLSVPLVVGAGWVFAGHLEEVKRDLHEVELVVAALAVLLLAGWWGLRAWRRRRSGEG
jgi:membrane protein DedA with SNARE-associated domain